MKLRFEPVGVLRVYGEQEIRWAEHPHPYKALDLVSRPQQRVISSDQVRCSTGHGLSHHPQIGVLVGAQAVGATQRRVVVTDH